MDNRKFESGASATPPTPPASPSSGYPTNGNPATAVPATLPGEHWFHQIGEELRGVITAAGLTPDNSDLTQLTQAIQQLISAGGIKVPVRAATTANIASLAGGAPNTLDGVTLVANDRVLVKDQTTGSQNGLYVITTLGTGANGTWTRAGDADATGELVAGMLVVVQEGTTYADTVWELQTDGTITVGTTSLTFARKDSSSSVNQIQPVSASVAGNALTLTLGATTLDFRASTIGSGAVNKRTVSSLITLTVSSGSTLGTVSGQMARLALIAIDNAGAVELAVANIAGGVNLDETTLISTTAEGGAGGADSASVIYSTAARTNVPFRVVGFVDISEAAAGTWATAPATIQGGGGQAMAALSSIGYGQTWQSVTRTNGTTYYNTTGRPIMVSVGTISGLFTATVNGATAFTSNAGAITFIVPAGVSYVMGSTSFSNVYELR